MSTRSTPACWTELNTLVLNGTATGIANINLNVLRRRRTLLTRRVRDSTSQSGFIHVDASGMTGFGVLATASQQELLVGSDYDDVFVFISRPRTSPATTISGGHGTTMAGRHGHRVVRFASTTNGQIRSANRPGSWRSANCRRYPG